MKFDWNNRPWLSRRFCVTITLAGAALLGGCQSYHPKPLTADAVNAALTAPRPDELRIAVSKLHHPLVRSTTFDPAKGLTPEVAGVLALLINPSLRAARDQRSAASAQLLSAGILPNPVFTANEDFPYGAASTGALTAYGLGVNWDVTSLITQDARVRAAQANVQSIDLSVAWQEWQVAQAARTAVYDLAALQQQLVQAQDVDLRLAENLDLIRDAVDEHQKTLLDLAAAEAASGDAHTIVLSQQHDLAHQRQVLIRALGLAPDASVRLDPGINLPARLNVPSMAELMAGLEQRRLDLVALRIGYESQEQTVRGAVLAQFPKINLGLNKQRDNTGIDSFGYAVSIDLPIFDRNQGVIATETATRQRLYDEYIQRIFEARSDIATAVTDINSINKQIEAIERAIPSLEKLVATYKTALSRGNFDVLSYYAAVNNLTQKRIDELKLKQQLADNRVALEIAAGEYLPDTAAQTGPSPSTGTDVSITTSRPSGEPSTRPLSRPGATSRSLQE